MNSSSSKVPKTFKGIDNLEIPSIGLGTFKMFTDTAEVTYSSIKDGVRLIDTASGYQTEEGVGKGIKRAIEEGIVKREELFITTKIGKNDRSDPEAAIKKSLQTLGLDYIDLYLDHWPKYFCIDEKGEKTNLVPLHIFWPKMEKLVEKGYTKFIGVSNYNVQSLCNLLSFCNIKPAVNEVEFHPYLNQKNLVSFCKRENIIVYGYNPLVKGCYSLNFSKETNTDLLGEKIIVDLAKKYNKTPGQIVLNWIVMQGVIPIPMTNNPNRMKENLGAVDFSMEEDDLKKIDTLNKMFRFGRSDMWNIYNNEIDVFA